MSYYSKLPDNAFTAEYRFMVEGCEIKFHILLFHNEKKNKIIDWKFQFWHTDIIDFKAWLQHFMEDVKTNEESKLLKGTLAGYLADYENVDDIEEDITQELNERFFYEAQAYDIGRKVYVNTRPENYRKHFQVYVKVRKTFL